MARYAARDGGAALARRGTGARARRVHAARGGTGAAAQRLGRFAAEDVRAVVDLPPFPSSAMDGFALRAADTPGRLPVVEGSRPAFRRPAPCVPVRRWRSRPAVSCRTVRMPSSRSSMLSNMTTRSRLPTLLATVTTSVRAAATLRRATSSSREVRASRRRRSALAAAAGAAAVRARVDRASRCSRPERSFASRASRSGPVRCTRRTASCSRPRSPPCRHRSAAGGRRRRGRASRRARAWARGRRARDLRRRLRRPARSRPRPAARARRRGGVLGRRRQAGEAGGVRCARLDARLRAAGQPRLVARQLRAVRPPCGARPPGRAEPWAGVRRRAARRAYAATPSGTSSCARGRACRTTVSCSSRSRDRSRT